MNEPENIPGAVELEMEQRLWEYIDGSATAAEVKVITALLTQRIDWALKYSELLDVHTHLQNLDMEEPPMRFTKNVMEEIARHSIAPATRQYINKNVIRGIGLFFVTTICALAAYGLKSMLSGPGSSAGDRPVPPGIDYTTLFNGSYVSGFVMINILLALLLLDRYLRSKNHSFRNDLS